MSPTQSITCRHGGLLPEVAGAKAKRIAVPPVVWQHLRSSWRPAEEPAPAKAGSPEADMSTVNRCVAVVAPPMFHEPPFPILGFLVSWQTVDDLRMSTQDQSYH